MVFVIDNVNVVWVEKLTEGKLQDGGCAGVEQYCDL